MKETNSPNIEKLIIQESKGLPSKALSEILHFTRSLKNKRMKKKAKSTKKSEINVKQQLQKMNSFELIHLEEEFKNYKKLFPIEK